MDDAAVLQLNGRYWRWFPPDQPLGAAEAPLTLPRSETVFLLVDVYGKRFDDDAEIPEELPAFYRPTMDDGFRATLRDRIVPAKAAAKRAGLPVVYVTNRLSPGLSAQNEFRNMSMRTCDVDVLEAWKAPTAILEHAAVIAPGAGEPTIPKQQYSGFFETNLDTVLRGFAARNLVIVGFDSRICLSATATDAMYRDYRVIVLRDAIRTVEYPETREGGWANFMAVRFIESNIGYTTTTDEFIAACDTLTSET